MKIMTTIPQAVQNVNLHRLIDDYFPQARKGNRIICQWRDGKRLSGYFFNTNNHWRLHDPVEKISYDAYDVLTKLLGFTPREASKEILERSNTKAIKTNKIDESNQIKSICQLSIQDIINDNEKYSKIIQFILKILPDLEILPIEKDLHTWKIKNLKHIISLIKTM
jgi:predicted transcriptional regulator